LEKVTLISHFSRAEMSGVSDGRDWLLPKDVGDIKGSSLVIQKTIIGNWTYTPPPLFYGDRKITVDLWDTFLLLPRSLEYLGDLIGLEKLESNGYRESDQMLDWLRQDRKSFEHYALRDAEIAVKFHAAYCKRVEEAGLTPTKTVGGIFEREAASQIHKDYSRLLYTEKKVWNGRYSRKGLAPIKEAQQFQSAYYGGHNETFITGYYPGSSFDYDLVGAYSGILGMLPAWNPKGQTFTDPERLYKFTTKDPLALGRVEITFEFKEDVRYPCLPIDVPESCIIFPSTGQTICTLQEFITAYPRLKQCSIVARVYPSENESSIVHLVRDLKRRRQQAKAQGDTLGDELWKLALNAGYGKFAQGLRKRESVDTANTTTDNIVRSQLPTSRIANPAIASYITGWCRSMISEYLFWCEDQGIKVATLSTDGFTVLQTPLPDQVFYGVGPLTRLMASRYETPILELKHQDDIGLLVLKTRGYAMLGDKRPLGPLVAMTGVQRSGRSDQERAAFMFEEWRTLTPFKATSYPVRNLPTLAKWITNNEPPTTVTSSKSWNFDYDWKRCPINAIEVEGHLQFETRPWQDPLEYTLWRDCYQNFRRGVRENGIQIGTKNKVTNLSDLQSFQDYVEIKTAALPSMAYNINRAKSRIVANVCYKLGDKLGDHLGYKKIANLLGEPAQTVKYWVLKQPMSIMDMKNPAVETVLQEWGVKCEPQGISNNSHFTPLEWKTFFAGLLIRWKVWIGPTTGVLVGSGLTTGVLVGSEPINFPLVNGEKPIRRMVEVVGRPQMLGPPSD